MTKKKNLILLGGGGHCESLIDVVESAGYTILGILDQPEHFGKTILSTKIIGTDDDIPSYVEKVDFIISVGFIKDPSTRIRLFNRIKEAGGNLATVIASTAYVSRYATLGEGTIVMHNAFVNAGVQVGENTIINSFSDIEHNSIIGDQCHISTGAIINGNCRIGKRCFIGSQSVLGNGVIIADDIIIGAGSVVKKNLQEPGIYTGNPAIFKTDKK